MKLETLHVDHYLHNIMKVEKYNFNFYIKGYRNQNFMLSKQTATTNSNTFCTSPFLGRMENTIFAYLIFDG